MKTLPLNKQSQEIMDDYKRESEEAAGRREKRWAHERMVIRAACAKVAEEPTGSFIRAAWDKLRGEMN